MKKDVFIGFDVGSVSVKLAAFFKNGIEDFLRNRFAASPHFFIPNPDMLGAFQEGTFILSNYCRHHGEPITTVTMLLDAFHAYVDKTRVVDILATGSGGKRCSHKLDCRYVNEYQALAGCMAVLYPEVSTIFELGGERSKYLLISRENNEVQILDYETNGECAAGTGSFFDQQVDRLKYRIEDVGDIIEDVDRTASIAGRCSVFAKSDMIHAQQRGYCPPEVLKGLCDAVVRNFKGSITKGKQIEHRVAFIGGVAANKGVVTALRSHFNFSDGELIVPDTYAWLGAMGAALLGDKTDSSHFSVSIASSKKKPEEAYPTTDPLTMEKVKLLRDKVPVYQSKRSGEIDCFLGIDVGSVSTNLALIDPEGELIHGIYRMTEGRPIEVVKDSLIEMVTTVGNKVHVRGVGTTGSGRELAGLLVGADVVKDEITAHKTGAIHISHKYLDREVDTIFEVGGQDSKFISIKDGVVVDFSLNEACAAGTGSFLEEQAKQINISIVDEFAKLALSSKHPLKLGERCTVFMEKELVPYLHRGVPKEDITSGLALSIVQNYLNRVVKKRKIGDVIFFQGGTAYNDSVAAAFSTVLDKEIVVPPHNGIMGAIGAALLAMQYLAGNKKSSFRGWDLNRIPLNSREFTCNGCSNACLIQEFEVAGEKSYWGDKCSEKYRKRTKTEKKSKIQDLFQFREQVLTAPYCQNSGGSIRRGRIGIPRALYFYDRLPFWKTYFESLGFDVVLSGPSMQKLVNRGVETSVAEPCFPIQVVHGHLVDLLNEAVDHIFLPNVVNEEDPTGSVASFLCPWGQTIPLVTRHTPALTQISEKLFYPNIQFRLGREFVEKQLKNAVLQFGVHAKENKIAVGNAYNSQSLFRQQITATGRETFSQLIKQKEDAIILIGRPYNLFDSGLNLNIPNKLREVYGANVIPMDFLPLDGIDIRPIHGHMFWNYGRRILQAARFTRDYTNLHLIYLSNFKCGPDSYIRHYIEDASGEPFLLLQLDSHVNDAGVMTRIEAFLESKGMI